MRSVRDAFPSRYLMSSELQPVGPTLVTIRSIWQGGTDVDEKTGETFPLYLIAFNEFHKPAKLKSGFAFSIGEHLGEDMDLWIGREINIQPVNVMAFGKMHTMVGMAPHQPAAGPALPQGQAPPKGGAKTARNLSPIGAVAAGRFTKRLGELSSDWGGFLAHLKATDVDAHADAYGKEIAEVPAWLMPLMKHYLDLLEARKPVSEDDIPF